MTKSQYIHVPALKEGERIIVPQFWLGKEVEHCGERVVDIYQVAPTLAELVHAFFDKGEDGQFVSLEYRMSVRGRTGGGEWVSTYLRNGKEVVERPERVFHDDRHGWMAEGGKVARIEPPPGGWVLEFDKPTGFPARTSLKREDAERIFGDDTSYFWFDRNGLRAIFQGCSGVHFGPFSLFATWEPGAGDSDLGVRVCARSEPKAERPPTPMYTLSGDEYEELMKAYRKLMEEHKRMGELLSRLKFKKKGHHG